MDALMHGEIACSILKLQCMSNIWRGDNSPNENWKSKTMGEWCPFL